MFTEKQTGVQTSWRSLERPWSLILLFCLVPLWILFPLLRLTAVGSVLTGFALFLFPLFSVCFFFPVYQKKKERINLYKNKAASTRAKENCTSYRAFPTPIKTAAICKVTPGNAKEKQVYLANSRQASIINFQIFYSMGCSRPG